MSDASPTYRARALRAEDRDVLLERCGEDGAAVAHALREGQLFGVVVESPSGETIAALAAMRRSWIHGARERGLGLVRVAFVDEAYRIGGGHALLRELDSAFAAQCEGAERPFQVLVGRFDEGDMWWLRAHCGFQPAVGGLHFVGVPQAEAEGAWLERADSRESHGAAELRRAPRAAGVGERLAYLDASDGDPLYLRCRQVQGETIVTEVSDFTQRDELGRLLAFVAEGRPLRLELFGSDAGAIEALQDAGLRVHGPESVLAARVSGPGLAPSDLFASLLLSEELVGRSALPRMSIAEAIASPPPAGTHWEERPNTRRS